MNMVGFPREQRDTEILNVADGYSLKASQNLPAKCWLVRQTFGPWKTSVQEPGCLMIKTLKDASDGLFEGKDWSETKWTYIQIDL